MPELGRSLPSRRGGIRHRKPSGASGRGEVAPGATTCCSSTQGARREPRRASCGARTTCLPCSTARSMRYPEDASLQVVNTQLEKPGQHAPPRLLLDLANARNRALCCHVRTEQCRFGRHASESELQPVELLDLVQSEQVTELCIVGDSFARPIASALDAEPDRWDLSSLWMIVSSGVMWSAEVKAALLKHESESPPRRYARIVRGHRDRSFNVQGRSDLRDCPIRTRKRHQSAR